MPNASPTSLWVRQDRVAQLVVARDLRCSARLRRDRHLAWRRRVIFGKSFLADACSSRLQVRAASRRDRTNTNQRSPLQQLRLRPAAVGIGPRLNSGAASPAFFLRAGLARSRSNHRCAGHAVQRFPVLEGKAAEQIRIDLKAFGRSAGHGSPVGWWPSFIWLICYGAGIR